MFSSSSNSNSFMGLRWKGANDGTSSTLQVPVPSTAGSTDSYFNHGITDVLEPAMDSPPSPEGLRALGRRMKRGSVADQQQNNDQSTSSGSSSLRSDTPETLWERGLENLSLSRNPSQRSLAMPFKDRPDSVQLFGKAVFGRRPRLRREQSEQGYTSNSLLSLSETPAENAPDPSREQGFIQSMFQRRARGTSEASQKRFQISGPYDFQHVSHSSKENLAAFAERDYSASNRQRTKTGPSITPIGPNTVDKPLPTPPMQDFESISPRGSIQMSPRRQKFVSDEITPTPQILPPRTSSRASARHDRNDSFSTITLNTGATSTLQTQQFRSASTDGPWPPPLSRAHSDQHLMAGEERRSHSIAIPSGEESSWPLTSSMTSLPEVPEEEECHMGSVTSHPGHRRNPTVSLRGSVSVPHLRRISVRKSSRRTPSNASETLGTYEHITSRRPLYEVNDVKASEITYIRDSWEDDIDYCYDHAAEADCDFAWERPSCDFEREDYYPESPILSHMRMDSNAAHLPPRHLSVDVPGLSPTSNGSGATSHGATTPVNSLSLSRASNFSLPKIDTSVHLRRDDDSSSRTHSGASSSVQEVQEFHLSPSLLIPDEYHQKILSIERGDLTMLQSGDESTYLGFEKPGFSRSSASTTISTLSEQSSRYPSSGFSSRWTHSSASSADDRDHAVSPTSHAFPSEEGVQGRSRANSDANLLMKMKEGNVMMAGDKGEKERAHRRTRTASRSHNHVLPQFALSPQVAPQY